MKHLLLLALSFFLTTGLTSSERNLIVIRHGEASNNLDKTYNSNPESPNYKIANLTDQGRQTVIRTAKELLVKGFNNNNIVAVISSPLPRAAETAETLVQQGLVTKNKLSFDDRLTEQQAGDLEGNQVKPWNPEFARNYHAESKEQVESRVEDFYKDLLKKYPSGNIVVVTHQSIAEKLLDLAGHPLRTNLGDAKVVPLP